MKLIYCKFLDGMRFPILTRESTGVPYLLPLTYTILALKGKSHKTVTNHLIGIKILYEHFKAEKIDLEEKIIMGDFKSIIRKLDSICCVIYNKTYSKSLKNNQHPTSNQVYDGYIRAIRGFLKWSALRYKCSIENFRIIEEKLTAQIIHNPASIKSYKSLSKEDLETIKNLVDPSSHFNPFKDNIRLRNWLIIEIILQSGLRIGELLKLKTVDIVKNGSNYYLRAMERENDKEDSRRIVPSLKNRFSERVIGLDERLYDLIENYMKYGRRPKKNGKTLKINHGYLFTSERGLPLSQNTVANIFKVIENKLLESKLKLSVKLSAHILRHSFAENFLKYLIEIKEYEMERAKDELRQICGWTQGSIMPTYYTSRYINKIANDHNLARINNLYKK